MVYRNLPILNLWWIILSPGGERERAAVYVVPECLGTKVNRLDKGLHGGEETAPGTEILRGFGCGFVASQNFSARRLWKDELALKFLPLCFPKSLDKSWTQRALRVCCRPSDF